MTKLVINNNSIDEPKEKRELERVIAEKTKLLLVILEKGEQLKVDLSVIKQEYDIKIVDDETLALMPELELRGEGAIEAEALNDLKNEIIDLFEYLNGLQDKKLGAMPKRWKKIVNSFVEKRNGD